MFLKENNLSSEINSLLLRSTKNLISFNRFLNFIILQANFQTHATKNHFKHMHFIEQIFMVLKRFIETNKFRWKKKLKIESNFGTLDPL